MKNTTREKNYGDIQRINQIKNTNYNIKNNCKNIIYSKHSHNKNRESQFLIPNEENIPKNPQKIQKENMFLTFQNEQNSLKGKKTFQELKNIDTNISHLVNRTCISGFYVDKRQKKYQKSTIFKELETSERFSKKMNISSENRNIITGEGIRSERKQSKNIGVQQANFSFEKNPIYFFTRKYRSSSQNTNHHKNLLFGETQLDYSQNKHRKDNNQSQKMKDILNLSLDQVKKEIIVAQKYQKDNIYMLLSQENLSKSPNKKYQCENQYDTKKGKKIIKDFYTSYNDRQIIGSQSVLKTPLKFQLKESTDKIQNLQKECKVNKYKQKNKCKIQIDLEEIL